jgi:hypothetical protein
MVTLLMIVPHGEEEAFLYRSLSPNDVQLGKILEWGRRDDVLGGRLRATRQVTFKGIEIIS